jgi:hypothetical protein
MKAWVWVLVAAAGFTVMLLAYATREPIDSQERWATGLIVISPEVLAEKIWLGIPARLRLLSSSDSAELLLFATGDSAPDKALKVKGQVRVKLIELPLGIAGIRAAALQSGRLPEPGRDEVLAGARIEPRETLLVGGRSLKVVGVLKPDVALFANSYLVPSVSTDANNMLFPAAVPSVFHARLVHARAEQLRNDKFRKRMEEVFPPAKCAWVTADDRLERPAFHLYLSGLAVFLLGGSGALIAMFNWLAGKVSSPVVAVSQGTEAPAPSDVNTGKVALPFYAAPLLEMKARRRLVWGVHLFYFGLVIAGSLLVYELPGAQVVLLGKVGDAIATRNNPLGFAGEAYRSGFIPLAAAVTFVINFLLGSLAVITVPSIVLPGSGVFMACLRAAAWGMILAPATHSLAYAMLPHSVTMLLEGEGYILATIFGLLVPIHIVKSSLGGNPLTRFGRAVILNRKANFWIALVLAVAAVYEATEVILMNR